MPIAQECVLGLNSGQKDLDLINVCLTDNHLKDMGISQIKVAGKINVQVICIPLILLI
jgi:hypothetical protein